MASPTVADIIRNPEKYRKMSEDAADNEFAIGIAPQLNYKGPIDPSIANYVGLEGDVAPLTLKGFIGKGGDKPIREGVIDGRKISIPDGPKGSINAVDKGATADTYGHEYRHKQKPEMSELTIRAYDGYNAQSESEFQDAVLLYGQSIGSNSMKDAEKRLLSRLGRMEKRKNDSMNDNPYWKRRKNNEMEAKNK